MSFKQFLSIVYMPTKVISMVTFASGTLFALYSIGHLKPLIVLFMGLATLFVDMGTTGFNSYFDYRSGTDSKESESEDDKVLGREGVNPSLALLASVMLFGLAAIMGLILAYLTNWKLLLVGGLCMGVGYAYTGGPFPICRTPFGELFAGFFLGTTLFLISYYVQVGSVSQEALLVSLPFLVLIGMILTVNNSCDRLGDARAGRKTLTIVMGKWGTSFLLSLEGLLFLSLSLMPYFMGIYPLFLILCLIPSFLWGAYNLRKMIKRGFSEQNKQANMGTISQTYVVFTLCFSLGALFAHFLV